MWTPEELTPQWPRGRVLRAEVAAASLFVNCDRELGPRKTETLPYMHGPNDQTPQGEISCSEFPVGLRAGEEKSLLR